MMKNLIIELFGEYTPVSYMENIYDAAGEVVNMQEVVASGVAGVDWPWLVGVLLFALVLYSLFRLLGVFFK